MTARGIVLLMDPFLKMDIFFFVTTIVVLGIGIILFLVGLRMWRILGHIERIAEMAERETELIREDIVTLRADVRRKGFKIQSFVRLFKSLFTKRSSK